MLEFGSIVGFKQLVPPHPDVSIVIDSKAIGIELTTIYKDNLPGQQDSQSKKNESLQASICNGVRKQLDQIIDYPIEIHLGFNDFNYTKRTVSSIGTKITELIKPHLVQLKEQAITTFEITDDEKLPIPINRISGIYLSNATGIYVYGANASFPPGLSIERIYQAVRVKEKKITNYEDKYDECWLVLCIQTEGLSSFFNLDNFNLSSIDAAFHRIYLLQLQSRRLKRLK